MHDPGAMCGCDRVGDLNRVLQRVPDLQLAALDQAGQ
jgi:hypothetical protein